MVFRSYLISILGVLLLVGTGTSLFLSAHVVSGQSGCNPWVRADVNGDGVIDGNDHALVSAKIRAGASGGVNVSEDINCDGLVNASDLWYISWAQIYGTPTPSPTMTPTPTRVPPPTSTPRLTSTPTLVPTPTITPTPTVIAAGVPTSTPTLTVVAAGVPTSTPTPRSAPPPVPTRSPDAAPMLCEVTYILENLLSTVIGLAGIACFILLVWGSVQMITAGANDQAVAAARGTITWAIIGLVLIVASYFVIVLISNFTGVSLLEFKWPWVGGGTSPCG